MMEAGQTMAKLSAYNEWIKHLRGKRKGITQFVFCKLETPLP